MPISLSLLSPPSLQTFSSKTHFLHKPSFLIRPATSFSSLLKASTDNGAGIAVSAASIEEPKAEKELPQPIIADNATKLSDGANGAIASAEVVDLPRFVNPRWVRGTWDLTQFLKDGTTDWDAVIDAEVKRRKWLQDNPETTSNDDPVVFDTSIIPWWAWVKRFHLPEAELLNGRAAMIGFFMAYLVDSLTGFGLVDQMGNFFCKTLLFVAVVSVLVIRKNEDFDNLKKLLDETTFYDKQWQATWQDDENSSSSKK